MSETKDEPPTSVMPLEHHIKKNIAVFAVYPLILLVLILVAITILISTYKNQVVKKALVADLNSNIVHTVKREASLINQHLSAVSDLLNTMRPQHQYLLSLPRTVDLALTAAEPVFVKDNVGAFYKQQDNGGSALYYSAHTVVREAQRWKARNTELLDDLYRSVVDNNDLVGQAYFISWDNMSRIYPFVANVHQKLGSARPITESNFYDLATTELNPHKNIVWTPAYQDPFGTGKMVSAVLPVYSGHFLEGVIGLGLPTHTLLHTMFEHADVENQHVMLLDNNNNLIAATEQIATLLNLVNTEPTADAPAVESNLQLTHDQSLNQQLMVWLASPQDLMKLEVTGQNFLLSKAAIAETQWKLVMLQGASEVTSPLQHIEHTEIFSSLIALLALLSCSSIYCLFLFKNAKKLSASLAHPIQQVTDWASEFATRKQLPAIEQQPSTIAEINCLFDQFKEMAAELSDSTDKLRQAQVAHQALEEKAHYYQKMAHTDPLTGLHNRKHMDAVLKFQSVRVRFSAAQCCIMLLDVDHFKQVNDQYGHQMGDLVLQKVSAALSTLLRTQDVIARWGGEEFLLLCPNTCLAEAAELAENLRYHIESMQILPDRAVTVSIGIAQMKKNEKAEQTIARADLMLYKSKHSGRNKVNVAPADHS